VHKGAPYFTRPALVAHLHYRQGIPRLVNALCDKALLAGFVQKCKKSATEPSASRFANWKGTSLMSLINDALKTREGRATKDPGHRTRPATSPRRTFPAAARSNWESCCHWSCVVCVPQLVNSFADAEKRLPPASYRQRITGSPGSIRLESSTFKRLQFQSQSRAEPQSPVAPPAVSPVNVPDPGPKLQAIFFAPPYHRHHQRQDRFGQATASKRLSRCIHQPKQRHPCQPHANERDDPRAVIFVAQAFNLRVHGTFQFRV